MELAMTRLPSLEMIRAFVAIVEHGRFNRAAGALGLTESAVSHRLRKLEEMLGVRLIERHRERAVPTDVGERFYEKVAGALGLVCDAVRDASVTDRSIVSITTSRAFAAHWLMPRYRGFLDANPGLELQLLITARLCDLEHEDIDLAIRYGRGNWAGYEAVHLIDEAAFPVASPDVAERYRKVPWPPTNEHGRIIVNAMHPREWSEWCEETGRAVPIPDQCTTLGSFDLALSATLSGAGLTMGRRPMVDEYLERGQLIAPFGTEGVTGMSYFAIWPKKRPLKGNAKAVLQWLTSEVCSVSVAKGHPRIPKAIQTRNTFYQKLRSACRRSLGAPLTRKRAF